MSDLIESSNKAREAVTKGLDYILEMHRHSASINCSLVSQNCKLIYLIAEKDAEIKKLRQELELYASFRV